MSPGGLWTLQREGATRIKTKPKIGCDLNLDFSLTDKYLAPKNLVELELMYTLFCFGMFDSIETKQENFD